MSTFTRTCADATTVEICSVLSAASRLLDRLDLTGATQTVIYQLGALADDLDAMATHPTNHMAAVVITNTDRRSNPDVKPAGMTVGDALVTMARIGMYDPDLLVAHGIIDPGDVAQHEDDVADAAIEQRRAS